MDGCFEMVTFQPARIHIQDGEVLTGGKFSKSIILKAHIQKRAVRIETEHAYTGADGLSEGRGEKRFNPEEDNGPKRKAKTEPEDKRQGEIPPMSSFAGISPVQQKACHRGCKNNPSTHHGEAAAPLLCRRFEQEVLLVLAAKRHLK